MKMGFECAIRSCFCHTPTFTTTRAATHPAIIAAFAFMGVGVSATAAFRDRIDARSGHHEEAANSVAAAMKMAPFIDSGMLSR